MKTRGMRLLVADRREFPSTAASTLHSILALGPPEQNKNLGFMYGIYENFINKHVQKVFHIILKLDVESVNFKHI